MMSSLDLPVIDLSSTDHLAVARAIRHACEEVGFFYVVNHGVEQQLIGRTFEESKKFFALPEEEKMKLLRKEFRGYSPLYAENLDPSSVAGGDLKESFYIGPLEECDGSTLLNQWPSDAILPSWRETMESYYKAVESTGLKLLRLIAASLDLDEHFFEKSGGPNPFLRLLHYPGDIISSDKEIYGASAHSDYGMITLLATNAVPGLQVCRDKTKQPRTWEDVPHVDGAFIVNIGDMMERWTNCLFRSTLHRVTQSGQDRFSIPFFMDPNRDCIVECLPSCCSKLSPPRFPPINMRDYLREKFLLSYGTY
ncbi:hypothetical protein MLD38_018387 [Melastoma candidum]|uniref:Uncharacterized protein n=1 Tax=Melastoma candidum TaxID=119954 RepID=A0ACB9QTQ1_9MYRT|nr:hypothetical protein MLD38_018387 [Melastoma candidum]